MDENRRQFDAFYAPALEAIDAVPNAKSVVLSNDISGFTLHQSIEIVYHSTIATRPTYHNHYTADGVTYLIHSHLFLCSAFEVARPAEFKIFVFASVTV